MKLARSSNKKRNVVIVVVLALVILAAMVTIILALGGNSDKNIDKDALTQVTTRPKVITGINVSVYPKMEYFVGEAFDPTGLRVQVISNKNEASYFVEASKLKITGFDSSVPNDALPITVTYQGYSTQFTVRIKEVPQPKPELELVSIKLSDNFKTEYTLKEWNDNNGPYLRSTQIVLVYNDGSEKSISVRVADFCSEIERHLDAPGTTQFKLSYQGFETIITVTITE